MAEKIYPVRDVHCPVCADSLGYRRFDQTVSFFCKECNYFWKFLAKNELPVGIKNKPPPPVLTCGCGRCGR